METYRNILVCVVGMTPQVVTEMMYYLTVVQSIDIHEIHLLTTSDGEKKCDALLLCNGKGKFYEFCDDFNLVARKITPQIHIITDDDNNNLSDIRTKADNRYTADCFLRIIKTFTFDENTRVFASLAGGRKTMSAYLMAVMQILGRTQDQLLHVLIEPERLENNPEFFYPKPNVAEMSFKDKLQQPFILSPTDIHIDVAEIPFVRLNKVQQPEIAFNTETFSELVSRTQSDVDSLLSPGLSIDKKGCIINVIVNQKPLYSVKLSPQEMTFYLYLIHHKEWINEDNEIKKHYTQFHYLYKSVKYHGAYKEKQKDAESFRRFRSKINTKISTAVIDRKVAAAIKIQSETHPIIFNSNKIFIKKYFIALPKDQIMIR